MVDNHTPGSMAPLVSVVVPAYNVGTYIDQCLTSIKGQTYANLEIIVVDDGSTDDTLEHVRNHAIEDARITVLTQENRYAGVARNYGLSHARGEYVAFLDADDFFEPDMIGGLVKRAADTEADVVVCRSLFFDDVTEEVKPIDFCLLYVDPTEVYSGSALQDVMFRFCVGWPWDKLFRVDFVRRHGLQFQDTRTTNDAYFVFMALMLADRIAFSNEEYVFHRTNNAGSLERTRSRSWANAVNAALAIGEGLEERERYDAFEKSYLNWFLNFSLWNLETLEGEARDGLVESLEHSLAPKLPADPPDGFYFDERERVAAELLRADRATAIRCGMLLASQAAHLRSDNAWLRTHAEKLDGELAWRDETIERLQREKQEVLQSRTYTVGKALMALPCAIKDVFSKKGASA
ncbi:glycosyltransferase family 2 protein [Raoultibacter phocaeensis]|uniref:glycosyltransferase family 2 protein n=1 Tax=Raoultibacter phocaeensis TaxID=2479841 RepID=UPI00111BB161|nr:glycosyltransferase family 2 protein [Raoultibacter phocaeensis]